MTGNSDSVAPWINWTKFAAVLLERLIAKEFGREHCECASMDFLWDDIRLVQETSHDRQGEDALTYVYEPTATCRLRASIKAHGRPTTPMQGTLCIQLLIGTRMKIYVDEHGFTQVEIAEGSEVLGDFLSGDVQGSVGAADEYINACLSVENGGAKKWMGTGNAHTVTIENKGVEIFNEYTEQSMQISSISNFRDYLEEWKKHLLDSKSTDK